VFVVGSGAFGSLIGGWLVRGLGITGPFWASAAVMTVVTCLAWRPFGRRLRQQALPPSASAAHADEVGVESV
jgi:hypothetical protein